MQTLEKARTKKSVQKIFEMTLRGVDCSELTCLWMAARSVGPRRAHKAMTWPRLHKYKDGLIRITNIYLYKYYTNIYLYQYYTNIYIYKYKYR